MSLVTTGQNTSVLPGKNTITTVGRRFPSGRSPKNGWRGSCYSDGKIYFVSSLDSSHLHFVLTHRWLILLLIVCFTENSDKKRQQRLLLSTVSPRTETTEGRLCKQRRRLALLVLVSVGYAKTPLISGIL